MSQNPQNIEDLLSDMDRGEEYFDNEEEQQQLNLLSHVEYYSKSMNPNLDKPHSEKSLDNNNMMNRQSFNLSMCEELRDSTLAVQNVLNIILKKADQMVYQNYIDSIVDSYAIKCTYQLSEAILKYQIVEPDDEFNPDTLVQDREDIEPQKPLRETWVRNQAEVEIFQPQPITEEKKESQLGDVTPKSTVFTPSRKSGIAGSSLGFGKANINKKSKMNVQIKPNQPVNMEEPFVIDDEEEKMRMFKNMDLKRRNDQEEKEKSDQIQQQKARTELKKDLKSKYTYDFQGKIIQQKAVKVEKLPPAHHQMGFHMKENEKPTFKNGFTSEVQQGQIDVIKNVQNNKKQDQNILQQQAQQQRESMASFANLDQQLLRLQPNTKLPYNEFQPSNGITLYYQQQIKEGPKHQETINTLEDLEEKLRLLQPREPMQITRSEYQRLTEKGNLVAGFKKPQDNNKNTQNILKDLDTHTTTMMIQKNNFGKINEESSFIGHSRTQQNFRKEAIPSSIKCNSTKLKRDLQILPEEEQAFQQQLEQNIKQQAKEKEKQVNSIQNQKKKNQTPNDEFNLRLMQSPEWGKQKGAAFLPQLPKSQKQNKAMMSQTLNTIYKLPRERNQGQGLKLTKVLSTQSMDFKKNQGVDDVLVKNNSKVQKRKKSNWGKNTDEDNEYEKKQYIKQNPYNFRGTFLSTHSKFTDTLRSTNYG